MSDRLISLGHKRLLPKDATAALALAESRAHALVDGNTFPFLGGLGHFLPNAKLETVAGRLAELEAEFWKAKDEFVARYGALRQSAAGEWRQMAEKLVADPERLIATIEAAFPAALDGHFGFDVRLFQIAVPEGPGLAADPVTVGDQRRVAEARQRAAQEAAQKIRRETETFVADCVASLREQTARLCEEMLESIDGGKTEGVHQKTLNRLVRFIGQFKQMNFAGDAEMEERLEKVRRELLSRTAEEYRDSGYGQRKLRQGLGDLAAKARDLARADAAELVERFGQMGRRRFHFAA